MDLLGGILSIAQLVIDSSLQGDWSGVWGNPVKLGLGNVSIAFDVVFMVQHYILYKGAGKVDEDGLGKDGSGGESSRRLLASHDEERAAE